MCTGRTDFDVTRASCKINVISLRVYYMYCNTINCGKAIVSSVTMNLLRCCNKLLGNTGEELSVKDVRSQGGRV